VWKRVALAVAAALAVVWSAGATALDRGFTAAAPVTALDATAGAIATALAWTPRGCESVVLWQPDLFARRTFRAPGPCPRTSTGRGIAAVATSSDRVVWLAYAGGNSREWTLWTATPTARAARRLRFARGDVDAPSPIVLGNGGEQGIPYAVGAHVIVIGPSGKRVLSWQAPARVVALEQGANSVGVLVATGNLFVVGLDSGLVAEHDSPPGEVRAFRIASVGVIVETRRGIEIRTAPGARLPVPAGARLVGFADGQLVYAWRDQIREYFRPRSRDVLLRRARPPYTAEFDRRGMAWISGRRVCWAVRVNVTPVPHGSTCQG
jgi:hypothetical protein